MLQHLFSRCASWGSSAGSRLYISMAEVRKPLRLSVEPYFCCLWAIRHLWTAPLFSLPLSQQGSVKNTILSSLALCLASVDTTNYTYQPLEIQVTPISETCSFPDDCSLGAVSDVPCCVWCAGGRVGHVRHQLPNPDPCTKRRQGTKQCSQEYLNLALNECQKLKTWIWMD